MLWNDVYMVVFRIIHILAGVIWVGSAFQFVVYLQPAAAAIGPAASPFMAELLGKRRLVDALLATGAVTVVGGLALYVRDWMLLSSFGAWIATTFGLLLTLGMAASLLALGLGAFGTRPSVMRLLALGREVAASGKPPEPAVAQEMAAIQVRLRTLARTGLALLIFAVLTMASARYL